MLGSGADDCIFPARFAAQLGINLREGRRYEFKGAGLREQAALFFPVTLAVGGIRPYEALVGFVPALNEAGIGLLGQNNFFEHFCVELDLRQDRFHITE